MAVQALSKVFLSASIPSPDRDRRYFETADIVAIRDSVRALATVVLPKAHLVWGGHPSITPLIRFVAERLKVDTKTHVTLYQSRFFEKHFPPNNGLFEQVVLTPAGTGQDDSISIMRQRMFAENEFKAAVFIGGMEGIDAEYRLFKEYHPDAIVVPLASTGAAAKILFDNADRQLNQRLLKDYAYMSLFRDFLAAYL